MKTLLMRAGNDAPVEIDGGIQTGNAAQVVAAGAEILVAGSAIYDTDDPAEATRQLRATALVEPSIS